MTHPRFVLALAAIGSTLALALGAPPLASRAGPVRRAGGLAARPQQATPEGATPASTPIEFDVGLTPTDLAGAEALARPCRTPGQPQLPPPPHARAVGEALLADDQASVNAVTSLADAHRSIAVEGLADRLTVGRAAAPRRSSASSARPRPVQPPRHVAAAGHRGTVGAGRDRAADLGRRRHRPAPRHARHTCAQGAGAPRNAPPRQERHRRNPAARRLPQRAAVLDLLRRADRHDRPALRRRLPVRRCRTRCAATRRRSCRAPTA